MKEEDIADNPVGTDCRLPYSDRCNNQLLGLDAPWLLYTASSLDEGRIASNKLMAMVVLEVAGDEALVE